MVWILVAVYGVPNIYVFSPVAPRVLCVRLNYAISFMELFIQGPDIMFKMTHIFPVL
jgi:hypothetical protein